MAHKLYIQMHIAGYELSTVNSLASGNFELIAYVEEKEWERDRKELQECRALKLNILEMFVWPTATVIIFTTYENSILHSGNLWDEKPTEQYCIQREGASSKWIAHNQMHVCQWKCLRWMLNTKQPASIELSTLFQCKSMKFLSHPGFMWQQLTDELYHIK